VCTASLQTELNLSEGTNSSALLAANTGIRNEEQEQWMVAQSGDSNYQQPTNGACPSQNMFVFS